MLRAGLCSGTDIEYWRNLFRDYLANTAHNDQVFFLQQQEAHEMEHTERFAVFPADHVEACAGMLDLFFAHITSYPITLTTLPDAVERYHARNAATAPVYMLTRDTEVRPQVAEYTMTMGGAGAGPWPDAFLYYDRDCQLAFVKGECTPRLYRSYVGKTGASDDYSEPPIPVFVHDYEKTDSLIRLTYELGHARPGPYGLAYWDELTGYAVSACPKDTEAHMIGGELLFLRLQLDGRPRRITVELARA
ncbi:hypothetical protein IDH44_01845 [Paenibacillus sp. IB182496]|uniref:Uncharacterized protein n=1 Tax=Paenibacillus sabuli TaxID=2772509 RepID=A0A927BPK4_9BACL|nr:hypothetical protein [Paenibacillus sabuli]MBD2843922.1 hypothetical protein [Paenibacillus sabuli]